MERLRQLINLFNALGWKRTHCIFSLSRLPWRTNASNISPWVYSNRIKVLVKEISCKNSGSSPSRTGSFGLWYIPRFYFYWDWEDVMKRWLFTVVQLCFMEWSKLISIACACSPSNEWTVIRWRQCHRSCVIKAGTDNPDDLSEEDFETFHSIQLNG